MLILLAFIAQQRAGKTQTHAHAHTQTHKPAAVVVLSLVGKGAIWAGRLLSDRLPEARGGKGGSRARQHRETGEERKKDRD